jgi:hypothetical protein
LVLSHEFLLLRCIFTADGAGGKGRGA